MQAARWSSTVTVTPGATTWNVRSNGIPDCGFAQQYLVPRPGVQLVGGVPTSIDQLQAMNNPMGAQSYNLTIPLTPTARSSALTAPGGMIGIAINGAAIYNPYEADQRTVALDHNFTSGGASFIDSSNGHPDQNRAYHYHGAPVCLSQRVDVPGQHSGIVGFLRDGFPVYGLRGAGGVTPTDLDSCNGHFGPTPEFPQGIWHYHFADRAPYSFRCYHGNVP
ncbi:MAG: YHYH protein [Chloroflexi bacterium]|nr:YHYH protein [Chloroflexota bacterium]